MVLRCMRAQLGKLPLLRRRRDTSFTSLVRRREFDRILKKLRSDSFGKTSKWLQQNLQQESPLHFILPYRPPLELVELLLGVMKESYLVPEEAQDSAGRTPLHVAVAHNCDIVVVERLLAGASLVVPALTRDKFDRFPLHWACCLPPAVKGSPCMDDVENRIDVVYVLLNNYSVAVTLPDADGKTPQQYADENGHDPRIVSVMEEATQRLNKKKKEGGKGVFRENSPRGVAEFTEQTMSSSGETIPLEILGAKLVRRGLVSGLFSKYPTDDEVSSLGWERGAGSIAGSSQGHPQSVGKSAKLGSGVEEPPPTRTEPVRSKTLFMGVLPRMNSRSFSAEEALGDDYGRTWEAVRPTA